MDQTNPKDNSIDPTTQQMLNQPVPHPNGIDPTDEQFLALLIEKIEKGEIKLLEPGTLLNHAVYENLDEKAQGKADFDALNLLATIREIYNLWKMGDRNSFQLEYLVHQIRLTKERLEDISGDIYII